MEQLPKIVQQRLQATAKIGLHPDPDLLAGFAEKSLNKRERAQVLEHLGQCTDCREVVSVATPEMAASSTIPAKSPWLAWPVLRWGALAACVVVVSAAVTLHYERRQSVATSVAEKAPAPAPPAIVTQEGQASNQGNEKLAAKMAPPSPFKSDREFAAAGKLAKQRQDTDPRSAASASTVNGLATGRLENYRREKNPLATDQNRRDQLTENRLATADAVNSANKPSALPKEELGGAAPAPSSPPATRSKAADTEAQTKQSNDNLDYAARGSSEMVTVEAESAQVETAPAAVGKAKDESDKKLQNAGAPGLVSRNVYDLKISNKTMPSWTLSADGALQRSLDSGRTWQTIPVASHVAFRALSANDSDIWVGGAAGALYHSSDSGQHWTQVKPLADGKPLTADIISVEFTDAQHGKLITGSRETWITGDGGAGWHRN